MIQIIAFILFNLCCFAYAVFQFKQIAEALKYVFPTQLEKVTNLQKIIFAAPVVIGVCQLAYFYLGARLYLEFGWVLSLFKGIKIITMMIDGEYTRKSVQIRILGVSIDTRKRKQ